MGTKMLDFSKPHVLRNEAEYDAAAAALDELLDRDPAPGTEDHDRLEFLTVLIGAYDAEHVRFADEPGSATDIVDFVLAQQGRTRAALAPLMGGKSRVSEFFSGTRPLSMAQLQALHLHLGIPAELLLPAVPESPTSAQKVTVWSTNTIRGSSIGGRIGQKPGRGAAAITKTGRSPARKK